MPARHGNMLTVSNAAAEQNRRPKSSSTLSLAGSTTATAVGSGSGSGSASETVDVMLDVSSIVLSTLKDVSAIPPVPFLSEAAGIAVIIIGVVQKARSNKGGFKKLAEDSCELVYAIIRAHKDISKEDEVSKDLEENLQQLVNTLLSIQKFSQKGASRNIFKAMFRSSVDAGKIQDYRERLKQSMRVFGLQSDISLRDTVAKLAAQQVEMMKELKNRESDGTDTSLDGTESGSPLALPVVIPAGAARGGNVTRLNAARGDIKITTVAGDLASKKVTKTTSNTNSYNMMTNSTLNTGNTTSTVTNAYHGHAS